MEAYSENISNLFENNRAGLTKLDSFLQVFCLLQGPCFFLFPGYLKDVGMISGIFLACLVTVAYLYLIRLYFWSEFQLKKYDSSIEAVSLYTLVELVFARIAKLPRVGLYLKLYLQYEIILSWFLGISFYLSFMCKNFKLILHNYGYEVDERMILLSLALPLGVVCFTPDLKTLNKAFWLSSAVIGAIIVETYVYIFSAERSSSSSGIQLLGSVSAIPTYVNNIIFSVVMTPLLFVYKNEMRRAEDFSSLFGSLNIATCATILLALVYSISCNVIFGDRVRDNIIENLPNTLLVNVSNLLMTVTIILSGAVVFYAIFMCLWDTILERGAADLKTYKYMAKVTAYVFIIGATAVAPNLSSFLDLVCCFSVPYDVIALPVILETVIVWTLSESAYERTFVLLKNSIIVVVAIVFAFASFIEAVAN